MRSIAPYDYLLPLVTAYVATWSYRLPGVIERALALALIIGKVYSLVPLAFGFSAYGLVGARGRDGCKCRVAELTASVVSVAAMAAVVIA